jgi:hypothetical protein
MSCCRPPQPLRLPPSILAGCVGSNSFAMAHGADGVILQAARVAAGCAVPALIALTTFTLGKAVRA